MISDLQQLKNLGPKSEQWLHLIGIKSKDALEKLGSVEAFIQIANRIPEANLNLLYALEGALMNLDWRDVPEGVKEQLVIQVREKTS